MQFTSNVDRLIFEHPSQAYVLAAAIRRWDSVIGGPAKSLMHQTGVKTSKMKKSDVLHNAVSKQMLHWTLRISW
jgi:hypothetical protein